MSGKFRPVFSLDRTTGIMSISHARQKSDGARDFEFELKRVM